MSEDDGDLLGPDGPGSSRVDRDRRAPRFSWTPAYETTFFRSLCDSVQLGLRENSSFKAEAWERAAQALQESHGAYPAKSHLINKSDNARKRFRLWRGLREHPDFMYNPVSKTVTASEDVWKAHIEKEPLSRALRGRPFDHEEYMEILYSDVIGSGGAPKRIMKPKRRADGQPCEEPEMPGSGVLSLHSEAAGGQIAQESPVPASTSSTQTPSGPGPTPAPQAKPTSTTLPPRSAFTQPSALTPPDEPALQAKKRALSTSHNDDAFGATSPSLGLKPVNAPSTMASPEKRPRLPSRSESGPHLAGTPNSATPGPPATSTESPAPAMLDAVPLPSSPPDRAIGVAPSDFLKATVNTRWREKALEMFFQEFADENMDLQIRIAETIPVPYIPDHDIEVISLSPAAPPLSIITISRIHSFPVHRIYSCQISLDDVVSYASVAASGPRQTPQEAAAPQPVEVVTSETASTASLIDVDVPGVRTVPADFLEQDVQTETQAERIEREAEASSAKKKAESAKKRTGAAASSAAKKARSTDNWLISQFSSLSDGSAGALAIANLAAIVGVSSYLGYKAWGLYERGRLDWKSAGVGFGILAGVGAVEAVLGRYLYKGKGQGKKTGGS